MGGHEKAARAKAHVGLALKRENDGLIDESVDLYLKAAEEYLESSQETTDPEEKKLRLELSETYYGKGISLRNRSKRKVRIDHTEGENEKSDRPEFQPLEKPSITFKDVVGLEKVKEEIKMAIIYPFSHPDLFEQYGLKSGDRIILYGPPGCGKTFIAKAAAGESEAAFINVKISDLISQWVGESEKNLAKVFDVARENSPSIIFFDEIDAIGQSRDSNVADHTRRFINQFLTLLDGVDSVKEKILILAATNTPWLLDNALTRPGRFSKKIFVPPPDTNARKHLFDRELQKRPIDNDVSIEELTTMTDGYSCADIFQICAEATQKVVKEAIRSGSKRNISMKDLVDVINKRGSSISKWKQEVKKDRMVL